MAFGNVPTYRGKEGMWMLYAWNDSLQVYQINIDVVPLAQQQAKQGYGAVGFWPLGMELREAVDWWTEVKNEPEAGVGTKIDDRVVHFFNGDPLSDFAQQPICQMTNDAEWVLFDCTDPGKICLDCQNRIDRNIK